MIEPYIKDILPTKPKNSKNTLLHLTSWKDELGQYSLSEISPALIAEKRDILASGMTSHKTPRSPSTVVRYMATLSHAFTIAVKEWGWVEDSPMRRVTKPKEPRGSVFCERTDLIFLKSCKKRSPPTCNVKPAFFVGCR